MGLLPEHEGRGVGLVNMGSTPILATSVTEAWAGGAHGKRLDGWQGRRVLMGCADCHDPHRPALETRIPFRAPQLQRARGRNP